MILAMLFAWLSACERGAPEPVDTAEPLTAREARKRAREELRRGSDAPENRRTAEEQRATGPPLILLISIDTLRPDHLGAYGYTRPTSPALDRIAQTSVVFDAASATSPWTLPSHASLLTGLYPHSHGLISHEVALPGPIQTLGQALGQLGYATAAVVNSHNLSSRFGLNRGFDEFLHVPESAERASPSSWVTDQAISWIEGRGDRPLFLFVHYYDVHSDYSSLPSYTKLFDEPYSGPVDGTTAQMQAARLGEIQLGASDARQLVNLYDAGIRQMDDELKRIFSVLEQSALLDDTLLVVTSDHGEEFLEHGSLLHGRQHYEESIRIPLFLRYPPALPAARIATPVSLVDVMPTILAIAGAGAEYSADSRERARRRVDGLDLSPLWTPDADASQFNGRALLLEADHSAEPPDIHRGVRRGPFKLHYDVRLKRARLFDLRSDPDELTDVSAQHPELVQELLAELERAYGGPRATGEAGPRVELTPEEKRRLESLGYAQ